MISLSLTTKKRNKNDCYIFENTEDHRVDYFGIKLNKHAGKRGEKLPFLICG